MQNSSVPTEKIRADQILVKNGFAESRARAAALIMAGLVFEDENRIEKPGQKLRANAVIKVRGQDNPWVSRGGLKLAHALDVFKLNIHGAICLDIGASTGGFTEVLLENGAEKVYAVDVGRGQLAWKLQCDDRVIIMDKTNARYLTPLDIPDRLDIIVCDASFISLQTVLSAPLRLISKKGKLIALIKPQFEVGRQRVGKGGIVREPSLHNEVCNTITSWLNSLPGCRVMGITRSPIKGATGNAEFLLAARF